MYQKPVLFLDSDSLQNIWGEDVGDTSRFNRIMDGLNQIYDIRITDVVHHESTFGHENYPKVAL